MKIIAREITVWLKDSSLENLNENQIFKLSETLNNHVIKSMPNTFKQLIITYDPKILNEKEIKTLVKTLIKTI